MMRRAALTVVVGVALGAYGCGGNAEHPGGASSSEVGEIGVESLKPRQVAGDPPGLTEAEQAQLELGKTWYDATCLSCHQANGQGQEGLAPPFDPEWLARPASQLIRIVLGGLRGPIAVKGRTYELEMPTLWVLEDDQIAAALSYTRHTFGSEGLPFVDPAEVAAIRAETEKRLDPWTVEELDALPRGR